MIKYINYVKQVKLHELLKMEFNYSVYALSKQVSSAVL